MEDLSSTIEKLPSTIEAPSMMPPPPLPMQQLSSLAELAKLPAVSADLTNELEKATPALEPEPAPAPETTPELALASAPKPTMKLCDKCKTWRPEGTLVKVSIKEVNGTICDPEQYGAECEARLPQPGTKRARTGSSYANMINGKRA